MYHPLKGEGRLTCAEPQRLKRQFRLKICLDPTPLSQDGFSFFGTNTRGKDWPLTLKSRLCHSQMCCKLSSFYSNLHNLRTQYRLYTSKTVNSTQALSSICCSDAYKLLKLGQEHFQRHLQLRSIKTPNSPAKNKRCPFHVKPWTQWSMLQTWPTQKIAPHPNTQKTTT